MLGAPGPALPELTKVVTLDALSVAVKLLLEDEMAVWPARLLFASVMYGVTEPDDSPFKLKDCETDPGFELIATIANAPVD